MATCVCRLAGAAIALVIAGLMTLAWPALGEEDEKGVKVFSGLTAADFSAFRETEEKRLKASGCLKTVTAAYPERGGGTIVEVRCREWAPAEKKKEVSK